MPVWTKNPANPDQLFSVNGLSFRSFFWFNFFEDPHIPSSYLPNTFTFTLRTVPGYIAGPATPYYDRKVVGYDGKSRISPADRVQRN
jgi:hypothetical protein